jgi:hypothetical protein
VRISSKIVFTAVGCLIVLMAFLATSVSFFDDTPLVYGEVREIGCQGHVNKVRIILSRPTRAEEIVILVGDERDMLKKTGDRSEGFHILLDYGGDQFQLAYNLEFSIHRGEEIVGTSCS